MLENTLIRLNLIQKEKETDEKFLKLVFIRTLVNLISLSIPLVLKIFTNSSYPYIIFFIFHLIISKVPYFFVRKDKNINYLIANVLSTLSYAVLSLIGCGIFSYLTTGLTIEADVILVMYANFIIIPFYFINNLIGDFIINGKELND